MKIVSTESIPAELFFQSQYIFNNFLSIERFQIHPRKIFCFCLKRFSISLIFSCMHQHLQNNCYRKLPYQNYLTVYCHYLISIILDILPSDL